MAAKPHRRLARRELTRHFAGHTAAVVRKPRRHLLQLRRHRCCVGCQHLGRRELHDKIFLHRFVRLPVVQLTPQLDDVAGRQLVLVLARLQHEGGRLDLLHDLRQRVRARHPLAEVAVHAHEVLLQERALGSAEQLLVDDLALTEDVLQTVAGKRSGQTPADLEPVDDLVQRLEPGA